MFRKSLLSVSIAPLLALALFNCAGEDPDANESIDPSDGTGMPSATQTTTTQPSTTATTTGSASPSTTSTTPAVQRESIAAKFSFTGPAPTYYEIDYLFGLTCATASCHTPIYIPPDLTNATGDLYDILTTQPIEQCENQPLVVPGDIDNSAMMMLMYGQCSEFVMPLGCTEPPCLFESYIEQFAHWIQAGALTE